MIRVIANGLLLATALSTAAVTAFTGVAAAADLLVIADAEEEIALPGGGTLTVWVGTSFFNAPVANGLGSVGDEDSFLFIQQTDDGAALHDLGWSGGASLWLPADQLTVYAALDGDFVRATHDSSIAVAGNVFVDVLPIDGSPSPGEIFEIVAGGDVDSTAIIKYWRATGAVGAGWEVGDGAQVALGVLGSTASLHLVSTVSIAGVPGPSITLDEMVDLYSVGPMIAGQVDTDVSEGVGISLSGRAALLYTAAELTAQQNSTGVEIVDIGVTDSASAFAGLVEAQAALNFAIGESASFSLIAGLGARNDYFSIVNPRSGPGLDANDPASYDPGPAHLEQAWLLEAMLGVGISGSF